MTAFFVWIGKDTATLEQPTAVSMFESLSEFGGDHADLMLAKNLAIGVQQKWMTREDVGEIQPLFSKNEQFALVFDGRIDNRSHLIAELNCASDLSDGALFFEFLQRFSLSRLAEVIGPFSFVFIDLLSRRVEAARDAMGGRYLCFYENNESLLLTSSELTFLSYPEIGHKLNEPKLACQAILCTERQPSAFIQGVSLVKPGDKVTWTGRRGSKISMSTFYRFDPKRRLNFKTDQEYVAEFRRLLDQAISRRLRCRGRVGAMLSGGLDSSPMVVSAAQQSKRSLVAYSWAFDRIPDEDERKYSVPLCNRYGVKHRIIYCDDLWPRFDSSTLTNPLAPFSLPYLEYHQATYEAAQRDNIKVMLHGVDGDLLYTTDNQQVIDAYKDVGLARALKELKYYKSDVNQSWWSALKRFVLAKLPPFKKFKQGLATLPSVAGDILPEAKLAQIGHDTHWLERDAQKALRPLQYQLVLDAFAGEGAAVARITTNQFGFEKRYPFRDRDLAEFMLAVPTRFLESLGEKRPILKQAYLHDLPENIIRRNKKTRFIECLERGIEDDHTAQEYYDLEPRYWLDYVKVCYFQREDVPLSDKLVVKWRCAYYNFWKRVQF